MKMYIEIYPECFDFYISEQQDFIKNHLDIPLHSVNNIEPFDKIEQGQKRYIPKKI